MKKLLFSLTFMLFYFFTTAQTFAPIGSTWHYSIKSNSQDSLRWMKVETITDTIFAGKSAKSFSYFFESNAAFPCPSDVDTAFMAKSNDSLFIYENGQWQMLVNFNAVAGDTQNIVLHIPGPFGQVAYRTIRIRVDSIRQLLVSGQSLKSVYLVNNNSDFSYDFHDGWYTELIGHEFALVPWVNAGCAFGSPYIYGRRCYSDSLLGSVNFTSFSCEDVVTSTADVELKKELLQLSPNPTVGKLFLKTDLNIRAISIYNIQGKRVSQIDSWNDGFELPAQSGTYFIRLETVNGKLITDRIIKL